MAESNSDRFENDLNNQIVSAFNEKVGPIDKAAMSTAGYNYKGQLASLKSRYNNLASLIRAGKIDEAIKYGSSEDILTPDLKNWLTSFESHGYGIPIVKSAEAKKIKELLNKYSSIASAVQAGGRRRRRTHRRRSTRRRRHSRR